MAVSGTSTFTLDARQIIDRAMARVGGEEVTGYDTRSALINLQLLFQDLQMRNVNLWTVELDTQALTQGDVDYTLDADTVDVLEMSVRDTSQTTITDLPVTRISRADYEAKPDKSAQGLPYQFFLDRQRAAPVLYLYQAPSLTTYTIRFWKIRRIYDQSSYTDDVDVPVRWLPTVISGLAYYMGRERRAQLGVEFVRELEREYDKDYGVAITEDKDSSPLRLNPDLSGYFT